MKTVIIGNGISGITAAREIRKKTNDPITIISAETEYFFSRTALMYIYMGHMKYEHTKPYEDWFWEKNKLDLVKTQVTHVDFANRTLRCSSGSSINYDRLILACGSKPNKFGWPGQNAQGVQGLYSFQDLENLESLTDRIEHGVIVGGGLIGIELAEMLKSRGKEVTMLVRESSFWDNVLPVEESQMINEHINVHHINLKLETELEEILTNEADEVVGVKTKSGEVIDCEFVGLTVGVSPNIEFLRDSELKTDRGILINEYFETNIKDVYAIGDCAQHITPPEGRRALEQIWYTGRIMGETLANCLYKEKEKYNPGVFFNSAKFLDIEYQTYGSVPAQHDVSTESFCWQHSSENILVRINFDKNTKSVKGVNTFGIRMRQEIWTQWISNNASIEEVMSELSKANFDPEFFKRYEKDILIKYNETYSSNLVSKHAKKSLLTSLFN